jgi:hypothetical protein
MDRLEVRVSITKILLSLIIVIVPLSIVGLVLTERSDKSLDNAIGTDLRTMAQMYSDDVTQFMVDRVNEVMAMAADPAVVQTVSRSGHVGANDDARASTVQTGPAVGGMLDNSASQVLRLRRDLDPRLLRVFATNANGVVVAATHKPVLSSYAQNELWQAVFNKGQGVIKIGDILYDELTKSYYVNIGMPISDPASSTSIGVLSAAVNISGLLSRFQQTQIANGARATLVKDDGTIVSAPNADVFARVKSEEYAAIRDSLSSLEGSQYGWTVASLRSGPYLIGYANTGLKKSYENLGWVVLVSQDERQGTAAIRQIGRFAMLMVILAFFMLSLLCVYYYLHRTQRFEHLAEDVPVEPQGRADHDLARR